MMGSCGTLAPSAQPRRPDDVDLLTAQSTYGCGHLVRSGEASMKTGPRTFVPCHVPAVSVGRAALFTATLLLGLASGPLHAKGSPGMAPIDAYLLDRTKEVSLARS